MPPRKARAVGAKTNGRTRRIGSRDLLFNTILQNVNFSRASEFRKLFDVRRDLDDECGYPQTDAIRAEDYRKLYDRDPIAARVVNIWPSESWKSQPAVYEDEDSEAVTAFEDAWDDLCRSLRGQSWYASERGNPVWEALRRADELSGVGHYGGILLGLDDGKPLNEPAEGLDEQGRKSGKGQLKQVLFMRCFDESLMTVATWERDPLNPRYGHPIAYNLTLSEATGSDVSLGTHLVHWTRVVHLADNLTSSEVLGVPRMQRVYNRLYDLTKLYGPSAEMYYKGAFPGMSVETLPQLGTDVEVDADNLKDVMEEYMNGLQRYLILTGMQAKMLSPTVVDPAGQINAQLDAICVILEIPKRIFVGSERGELASSQDAGSWNDRVRARQDNYVTPRIIVPFVDRLISLGVLPEPEEFHVDWPDVEALSEMEKASVAIAKTDAMGKYLQGGVEALMTPMDYMTRILEFSEEEATSILEQAEEAVEEKQEEQAALQEEQMQQQLKLAEAQPQQLQVPPGQKPSPFGGKQKEVGKAASPFEPTVHAGDDFPSVG